MCFEAGTVLQVAEQASFFTFWGEFHKKSIFLVRLIVNYSDKYLTRSFHPIKFYSSAVHIKMNLEYQGKV